MSVFFLGSWGMNRSAEQTNHPRTASRFTRFVCPALRFIPHEPRKKDTHSLNTDSIIDTDACIYHEHTKTAQMLQEIRSSSFKDFFD